VSARGTLRVRVTGAAVVLLAAALIVGATALGWFVRRTLVSNVEVHLDNQIDAVVELAQAGELPGVLAPTGRESGQIQVIGADGSVVAKSPGVASTARLDVIGAPPPGGRVARTVDGVRVDGDRGEQYRVVAQWAQTPTGPVVVYGASTLRSADRAARALRAGSGVGIPVLLLLAGLFAWRAVRRALAPVDAMTAEVAEIEAHALDRRVAPPAGDDEIARLARTLNHMLDRLDTAVRLQRRFAADASHELRSPLAASRAQLEVGLAYPDRTDWVITADNVLSEISRLERLAGELLILARLDAEVTVRPESLDLVQLVGREAKNPEWLGLPLTVRSVSKEPVMVVADPDLLLRVVRNLLANAARHARSMITLETGVTDDLAWIRVGNDGPPVPPEHRERIFEPFARLDGARDARAGGAGLGLAIARRIARSHGGDVILETGDDGASFLVTLRLATREG
jgi:signal transduction histidine kinase